MLVSADAEYENTSLELPPATMRQLLKVRRLGSFLGHPGSRSLP